MRIGLPSCSTPHGSALIAVLLVILVALLAGCNRPPNMTPIEAAEAAEACDRVGLEATLVLMPNGTHYVRCGGVDP